MTENGKYEIQLGIAGAKKTTIKGKNIGTPKNILVSPVHCSSGKLVLGACSGTFEPGANKPASEAGVTECLKEKVTGNVTSAKNTQWKTVYKKCKGEGQPANTTARNPKKSKPTRWNRRSSTRTAPKRLLVFVSRASARAAVWLSTKSKPRHQHRSLR